MYRWATLSLKYIIVFFLSIPSAPQFNRGSKPDFHPETLVRSGLRTVVVPSKVMTQFLRLATKNTLSNIETCGILAGKLVHNSYCCNEMKCNVFIF